MSDTDIEIVRNFMTALDDNLRDEYEGYLAESFMMIGWTPKPLNREGFLDVIAGLKEGIPGLIFNLHNVLEADLHQVTATWHVAGYQTDSFILPTLGMPPIPMTGRSISLPTEDVIYELENDLIRAIQVQPTEGGGIKGILEQLGIDVPIVM